MMRRRLRRPSILYSLSNSMASPTYIQNIDIENRSLTKQFGYFSLLFLLIRTKKGQEAQRLQYEATWFQVLHFFSDISSLHHVKEETWYNLVCTSVLFSLSSGPITEIRFIEIKNSLQTLYFLHLHQVHLVPFTQLYCLNLVFNNELKHELQHHFTTAAKRLMLGKF